MAKQPKQPEAFKSQPWTLFDTIASRSFLMGDTTAAGLAIGGQSPSIDASGNMTFFQASGRTKATMPWYTNLDVAGQLAYGLQVWQIYINIMFPVMPTIASINQTTEEVPPTVAPGPVPPTVRLMEAILNFGVLSLDLGQEQQAEWPLSRFGAGGGMAMSTGGGTEEAGGVVGVNNGVPQAMNVMKLPEPVEMGRTQNVSAKIRLAPEVFGLIGSVAAPGVGSQLGNYQLDHGAATNYSLVMQPFAVQIGFSGRRIKDTQYGQLVR